jgi:hypothetical protein
MAEFDYAAAAELFSTRRRLPPRKSFRYKRFAQAAQAIRELPPESLVGAYLEVDEQRYSDAIRSLYESAEYPSVVGVYDLDRQDDRA